MNEDLVLAELERLWDQFTQYVQIAEGLMVDAGRSTKVAMAGFSACDSLDHWTEAHGDAVTSYMEECAKAGHDPEVRRHLALCYGALMGMASAKVIDERLFVFGMSSLPGIAFARSGREPGGNC